MNPRSAERGRMTGVFVFGDGSQSLRNLLLNRLSSSYDVTYITERSAVRKGFGYELILCDLPQLKGIALSGGVFLMKENGVFPNLKLTESAVVIANSENTRQMDSLRGNNSRIITCGCKPTDTLSYSSCRANEVVVSLNRRLVSLSGRPIEPLEIPEMLPDEPENLYNLLALTALRLILDDYASELGKLYR